MTKIRSVKKGFQNIDPLAVACEQVGAWVDSTSMPVHNQQPERKTRAVIVYKTHTWQRCSFIVLEDTNTTKYNFDLREIALLCWFNGTGNEKM